MLKHARQIHTEFGFKKARFFVIKYLQFLPHSRLWLSFIESYYRTYTQAPAPMEMVRTKFMRSYYSRKMKPELKLNRLQAHYSVLETCLKPAAIATLLTSEGVLLGAVADKQGEIYEFHVSQHDRYRAEGELTVFMRRKDEPLALAALTFSFGLDPKRQVVMRIGGLQGPQADNARQLIVDTTKALYGQRPKALVLALLYDIAERFQAVAIEAVGTDNHPLRNKRHAFLANNDVFWQENSALKTALGNFDLPVRPPQRNLEDVPGKKRKDWLERQRLKDELKQQVTQVISGWFRV